MKIITIIPARGGSKSLPKKNILMLKGKPLLCHSIDYSLKSQLVTSTVVSTDMEEIANIAKNSGASVPFLRPDEFARDDTRDYPVIRHALDFFESQGKIFDFYILLRPTSPLRPPGLIEKAFEIFKNNIEASSVRSMARIKEHPYRAWKQDNDGSVCGFIKTELEPYNIPRQELPELFFQTGDIEVIRRETIISGSISGDSVYPLVIKHEDMIDIDSKSDFDQAEKSNANR
jgi:CMP-N,N'-diacetyllegionaminic acid synthase